MSGNASGKNAIEGGDAVGGDEKKPVAVFIDVANFAAHQQFVGFQMRLENDARKLLHGLRSQSQLYF